MRVQTTSILPELSGENGYTTGWENKIHEYFTLLPQLSGTAGRGTYAVRCYCAAVVHIPSRRCIHAPAADDVCQAVPPLAVRYRYENTSFDVGL